MNLKHLAIATGVVVAIIIVSCALHWAFGVFPT